MKYTILSTQTIEDTLQTVVLYEFPDGKKVTVSIPHFQPKSKAEVLLGIENRFSSEDLKNAAKPLCDTIAAELPLNQTIEK